MASCRATFITAKARMPRPSERNRRDSGIARGWSHDYADLVAHEFMGQMGQTREIAVHYSIT
jgi:hypothetical protein